MRPATDLPELVIELDGTPLPAQAARALEEARVSQRLSLPAQVELTFSDPPGPLEAVARWSVGSSLRLSISGHGDALFSGEITGIEYLYGPSQEREVRVRGYDLLHRLRKRQPVRAHVQETLDDLANELVSDLGIPVHPSGQALQWSRIIQHRQTDLDLLVEMAERCGVYLALREDGLHLMTLEGEGLPVRLALGDTLLEARIDVNAEPARSTVHVDAWDPLHAAPHSGSAGGPRSGRHVAAGVSPAAFGEEGETRLADELAQDDRQAQNLAQAALDNGAAREITLWGVAEGDPGLNPGKRIAVDGVDPALEGSYVLSSVIHRINPREGFVSEISTEPPARRFHPKGSVVALGVVTGVDDPESIGRVQVKLPAYHDVETGWMGVLCAAAGDSKGLVMLPDVGDQVVVLFPREDPAEGIVLGGLYGAGGPPDSGVSGHSVLSYTLLTRGGQKVRLDDGRHALHLEDSTGSSIDLSPEKVILHAAVDLDVEAPGHTVVIRGKAIDFESG